MLPSIFFPNFNFPKFNWKSEKYEKMGKKRIYNTDEEFLFESISGYPVIVKILTNKKKRKT